MKTILKLNTLFLLVACVLSSFPAVKAQEKVQPEKRVFAITGYYSPQPGQSFYLRGNLEDEKRLNGQGIRGASGVNVHDGMLAAPRSYTFGTKIKFEGLGIGTVEDRGGAIVEAGERGNGYDRIDVWMGYGEEGLKRALSWGIRKVVGYVYPAGTDLDNTINVSDFAILDKKWPANAESSLFKRNLGTGDSGDDVQKLEEVLIELGYLANEPGTVYDTKTIDAVYRFQVDAGIVKNDTDSGAGYCGQKTRKELEKKWYELQEKERRQTVALKNEKQKMLTTFPVALGKTSGKKEDIKMLQSALSELGYATTVSGTYDSKTFEAVFSFQKGKGIVNDTKDFGAGYFGSQTRVYLVEDLFQKRKGDAAVKTAAVTPPPAAVSKNTVSATLAVATIPNKASEPFTTDLKQKSSGQEVFVLQAVLQELSFLDTAPTSYYGAKTGQAVLAFQIKYGLAGSAKSKGAGIFGPLTREKFRQVYKQYQDRRISEELDMGEQGVEVAKLQNVLKKLGYFDENVTGKFGAKTKESLLKFQLENELIDNNSDTGAGRAGPSTIKELNKKVIQYL